MSSARRVVPFHRPALTGREFEYLAQCVETRSLAGDGPFTKRCERILEERFGIRRVVLTHSGTSALDVAARAIGLGPGDEVVLPSFTFVATANAVAACGARPVFVDVRPDTLNIDESRIEAAVTPRTKAIFPVHYAGCACAMDAILDVADRYGLVVVEDAAQGVDAYYRGRPLGTLGHLGVYSFHEAKNLAGGQVGAVCVNDPRFEQRVQIVRDKGTNREQLLRGEAPFYTWLDVGSAFAPSELCSAFLCAQLEAIDAIQRRRLEVFDRYRRMLQPYEGPAFRLPHWPDDCRVNGHIFFLLAADRAARDGLIEHLRRDGVCAQFHYVPLHASPMGRSFGYDEGMLPATEDAAARIVRLPLYNDLSAADQDFIVERVLAYWNPVAQPPRPVAAAGA